MDIKQLEAFVHVAKLGSFSKAAEATFLSQPTVSSHVASLEKELGVQLLIRSPKEANPTEQGRDFLRYAQDILALRDAAVDAVSKKKRTALGKISIVSSCIPAQYVLPRLISDYKRTNPQILFHVRQAESADIIRRISEEHFDLGIVGIKKDLSKVVYRAFFEDVLTLITPATMKANRDAIRENMKDFLMEHPIVIWEDGSGIEQLVDKLLSYYDIPFHDLKIAAWFSEPESVLQAVSEGIGVSFVLRAASKNMGSARRIIEIDLGNVALSRQYYLIHRRGKVLSPVVQRFADYLSTYFK